MIPEDAELNEKTAPYFMVITYDDSYKDTHHALDIAEMFIKLKKANFPAELHIFEKGGYAYGLRDTGKLQAQTYGIMDGKIGLSVIGFLCNLGYLCCRSRS